MWSYATRFYITSNVCIDELNLTHFEKESFRRRVTNVVHFASLM